VDAHAPSRAVGTSGAPVYCTNPPLRTAAGEIPERTLGRSSAVTSTSACMRTSHHELRPRARPLGLELAIRSGFADRFEVRGKTVTRKGEVRTDRTWHQADFSVRCGSQRARWTSSKSRPAARNSSQASSGARAVERFGQIAEAGSSGGLRRTPHAATARR